MLNMTADIAGLLDALEEDRAVIIGNDWGANIAWWYTRLYPERFAAVVALNMPYEPHPPASTEMIKQWAGTAFNFVLYFQEPGMAEAELEADVRRSPRLFLYAFSGDAPVDLIPTLFTAKPADTRALDDMPEPQTLPAWLTEADLDYCTQVFMHTGFRGALNRYRNLDRDWEELSRLGELKVEQPVFFIGGERDSAVRFGNIEAMKAGAKSRSCLAVVIGRSKNFRLRSIVRSSTSCSKKSLSE
jgi:pimeloyl-ACP methyl ester carboxylesterase